MIAQKGLFIGKWKKEKEEEEEEDPSRFEDGAPRRQDSSLAASKVVPLLIAPKAKEKKKDKIIKIIKSKGPASLSDRCTTTSKREFGKESLSNQHVSLVAMLTVWRLS